MTSVSAACVSVNTHVATEDTPASPLLPAFSLELAAEDAAAADDEDDDDDDDDDGVDDDVLKAMVKNGVLNRADGHGVGNCGEKTTVLFG